MKLLFLGGAGAMAKAILPLMRDDEVFEHVTIADLSAPVATERAEEFGDKFSGIAVDATNHDALVKVMKDHDMAMSFVGPSYFFEAKIGKAAVDAGINYISIADDYDAFLAVHDLDDDAARAGNKILTGFGNSPGLTQILAKKGYHSMDTPEEISVNWAGGSNEEIGPANILHVMHLMTGTTLQWRDYQAERVPCGGGRKVVDFPAPIGRIPVFYTGHAESVTLPRYLKGLKDVYLHGGSAPAWIFPFVAKLAKIGLTKTHERRMRTLKFITPFLPLFSSKKDPDKSVGRVEVTGKHEGNPVRSTYTYVGHIARITSLPCYLAAKWCAQGKFDDKPGGVYPPERLIDDYEAFLAELSGLGLEMDLSREREAIT
ncbi:saccharopine dehydrogenase NADP-binding domain-containing protein [bacterium]|nr:saccharopine dehydrogenase NADP-binding domain-containing protein [bacterium]